MGGGISVRIATDDDLDSLTRLRRAWNEDDAGGSIDDADFEQRFHAWFDAERATRTFFLVELDGRPIGMANVKRYERMPAAGRTSPGWWGYVGNVCVLPEHRDAGVGSILMDAIASWASTEGHAHLRLAPSPRSFRFYERLGYRHGAVVELDPPQRH